MLHWTGEISIEMKQIIDGLVVLYYTGSKISFKNYVKINSIDILVYVFGESNST